MPKKDRVWREVPSASGLLASADGWLMTKPYTADMPKGGRRTYGGEPTRGQWDGARYITRWRGRTYHVASLVCETWNGPRPAPPRHNCLHRDENSRNNAASNLTWGTQRENLNAPGFLAYCRTRTGEQNPKIKGDKRRAEWEREA